MFLALEGNTTGSDFALYNSANYTITARGSEPASAASPRATKRYVDGRPVAMRRDKARSQLTA
jgi:hypothetical protein